jgi:putative FmdB family regulatory protein
MPNYSYFCEHCNKSIEQFFYFSDYKPQIKCDICKKSCERDYQSDISSQSASVKKGDGELKTIGDLANRNRDRMSDDQRNELHRKHNDYKEQESTKELPTGMSRMKKPKKIQWR